MKALGISLLALRSLSAGVWVILLLFAGSGLALLFGRAKPTDMLEMWVFSPEHRAVYKSTLADRVGTSSEVDLVQMSIPALQSRMMTGFFGGLATADLIEVERGFAGQVFMGPPEAIGFLDLTPRLEAEGLTNIFNPPSLSPWMEGGRVFGLPRGVHPVMLAYRADLTEAAGIDLARAETWDEFFEMLRPLMTDGDGDGRPDQFPLSFWYTQQDSIEVLLLQGDGRLFDGRGVPVLDEARNAELIARMVSWCIGPAQGTLDIEEFTAAGHQARVEGKAIAYLCPDWMCSVWRMSVPLIGGKMKVMPLPAFEPGGRRASVRGGTMIGIPKTSQRPDDAWEIAKALYTSPEIAREFYRMADIISPVRSLWSDPIYDEPDPFFMGQAKGRMFIEVAEQIPARSSSPYTQPAVFEMRDAAVNLAAWANARRVYDADSLVPQATVLLERAQANVVRRMSRDAFAETE